MVHQFIQISSLSDMTASFTQQAILWCCAGLLMWAAVSDLRSYLIPNRTCLAVAALYPVYWLAGYFGGTPVDWSGGVLAAALIFAAGFVLFSIGVIGGGDVKLFSAVALWTGINWLLMLVIIVGVAGGIVSLGIVGAKTAAVMRMPADVRTIAYPSGLLRAVLKTPAPYGAAIAFGGLFIIYRLLGFKLL
jgi:prepilin peptidase CpaA